MKNLLPQLIKSEDCESDERKRIMKNEDVLDEGLKIRDEGLLVTQMSSIFLYLPLSPSIF